MNDWKTADRISDSIVDLLNEEIRRQLRIDEVEPLQVLAGSMMAAVLALMRTMGPTRPAPLVEVEHAIRRCLMTMPGARE